MDFVFFHKDDKQNLPGEVNSQTHINNMKASMIFATVVIALGCSESPNESKTIKHSAMNTENTPAFYDFDVMDIDGNPFDMSSLRGKRVLVVNVASKCGYTPQYEQLQELYETLGGEQFTIIGFPSNDFMGQEPGTEEEIKAFCQKNYGVTFPLMSKISVKGKNAHPLYRWLTSRELNGKADYTVKWNFHKFLIDENGKIVADYPSKVSPVSEEIVSFAEGK
jgi:glutathione peroxidase